MKIFKQHILYFIFAAILCEAFFGIGFLVTDAVETVRYVDIQVMDTFVDMRTDTMNEIMWWVTDLGHYEFVLHMTVIVGLLMAVFGHIEISLGIISGLALTHHFTGEAKNFFHIYRPDDFIVRAGGWSYPSGHVSGAAILAIMIMWAACAAIPHKLTRNIIICIATIYAIAVAISRMYLGVHWLSDVIGGILLAAAIAMLVMAVLKPVIVKRKQIC